MRCVDKFTQSSEPFLELRCWRWGMNHISLQINNRNIIFTLPELAWRIVIIIDTNDRNTVQLKNIIQSDLIPRMFSNKIHHAVIPHDHFFTFIPR
ncbi:Uncharacterised protein [Serratia rubidaea]|uniref:Uncharacterized protein n=1 Tax=Serratia rubidaea TaxID=61652 RepID=A0A4U9HDG0_SERRU|nr:Uncharacterised protein [Serratia rubidaea]